MSIWCGIIFLIWQKNYVPYEEAWWFAQDTHVTQEFSKTIVTSSSISLSLIGLNNRLIDNSTDTNKDCSIN